jgi:hypothetical protein
MSRPGPVGKPPTAKFSRAGTNGVEYYGIIEEIFELEYEGRVPLTTIIFKCH